MQKLISDNHWLRTKPVAHRGLHDLLKKRPENTLAAFEKAKDEGFPIELDVRLAKGGVPVVFHDSNTLRLIGKYKKINNLTLLQLKDLKIRNTKEYVPALSEVLKLIDGKVPIMIEIKNFLMPGKLEDETIKLLRSYKGEVALASFNPLVVRFLHKNYPEYLNGLIIPRFEQFLIKPLYNFTSFKFVFAQTNWGFSKSFKSFCKDKNLPVLAWTVKSKAQEKNARKFAGNIVFEGYTPL